MVNTLRRVHTAMANPRAFGADDLIDKVVTADEFRDVATVQGDTTTAFGAGFGPNDDRRNSDGWGDLDVVASGNGALNAGDDIAGKVRFAVYRDSAREDLVAVSGTYRLASLRNAVAAGRKDKLLIPGQLSDMAGNDSYLTLQMKANGASDGAEIDSGASTEEQGVPYSELKR